jgi:hypothetical protein
MVGFGTVAYTVFAAVSFGSLLSFVPIHPNSSVGVSLLKTKYILRVSDMKMFLELEKEYHQIIDEIDVCTRDTKECGKREIRKLLNDLRISPFFDNKYRPAYENLLEYTQNENKFELKDGRIDGVYSSYCWMWGLQKGYIKCNKDDDVKVCLLKFLITQK